MSAAAACSAAIRESATARSVPRAESHATPGTRPRSSLTTALTTARRSSSVSRWASPAIPRTVSPLTPVPSTDSTRCGSPSPSRLPSARNGVARMWKMPDRSSIAGVRRLYHAVDAADRDERLDGALEGRGLVRGAGLPADPRLSLGHHRVGEADDVAPLLEQVGRHPLGQARLAEQDRHDRVHAGTDAEAGRSEE